MVAHRGKIEARHISREGIEIVDAPRPIGQTGMAVYLAKVDVTAGIRQARRRIGNSTQAQLGRFDRGGHAIAGRQSHTGRRGRPIAREAQLVGRSHRRRHSRQSVCWSGVAILVAQDNHQGILAVRNRRPQHGIKTRRRAGPAHQRVLLRNDAVQAIPFNVFVHPEGIGCGDRIQGPLSPRSKRHREGGASRGGISRPAYDLLPVATARQPSQRDLEGRLASARDGDVVRRQGRPHLGAVGELGAIQPD